MAARIATMTMPTNTPEPEKLFVGGLVADSGSSTSVCESSVEFVGVERGGVPC